MLGIESSQEEEVAKIPRWAQPKARNVMRTVVLVLSLGLAVPGLAFASWREDADLSRGSVWLLGKVLLCDGEVHQTYSKAAESFCAYTDFWQTTTLGFAQAASRHLLHVDSASPQSDASFAHEFPTSGPASLQLPSASNDEDSEQRTLDALLADDPPSSEEAAVPAEWEALSVFYPPGGEVSLSLLCAVLADLSSNSPATLAVCVAFLCVWAAATVVMIFGCPWHKRNSKVVVALTAITAISCVPPLVMLGIWQTSLAGLKNSSLNTVNRPGVYLSFFGCAIALFSIPLAFLEYIFIENPQRSADKSNQMNWQDHNPATNSSEVYGQRMLFYEQIDEQPLNPAATMQQIRQPNASSQPAVGRGRPKPAVFPGNLDGARRAGTYRHGGQ